MSVNPLAYVTTPVPDDAEFKISPSRFAEFILKIHNWAATEVFGGEGFTYSTSSVIGTIVHYCAEKVAKGEEVSKKHIEEYIDMHKKTDNYDPAVVREQYEVMAETLVNDYVLEHDDFLEVETQHCVEISNKVYAAGTIDLLQGVKSDCLLNDYKSYNSKTKPKSIPPAYKYQLLVYAYILRKKGYGLNRIRLTYINRNIPGEISQKTQKQLKSYPPEVTVLTESVTQEDMDFIESQLELAVDTVMHHNENPHLAHITFHDPRLRS